MKSKKEYIFIRGEYKSSKEAFEEWEKYDSNTKWRNRLGYLITCVLREKIPAQNKLKDLENLNKSLKEIQDEGNEKNP